MGYRTTRSKRYMSVFIIAGALAVAAVSATLPDIPDNVDTGKLWQAAHERAVREGDR
jgi:hypothetical protein